MTKLEIFSCGDVPWERVEGLFKEMGQKEPLIGETATPLDLAVTQHHALNCPACGDRLIRLAEDYGIKGGVIFQEEKSAE